MTPQYSAFEASKRGVNAFGRARRVLRQLHLWVGLLLCLPISVLGLTGSILVFRGELANLLHPPPHLTCVTGKPHSIDEMIAAVQSGMGKQYTPFLFEPSSAPNEPATVRLLVFERAPVRSHVVNVLVDPVSLDLARWDYTPFPGLLGLIVRLHGNLLMGGAGRAYVGWIGVAMLVLGVSGLVLWWPRRNHWRAAFGVKRGARGLRLYRDLHGAVGIWSYFVFIAVTVSGIYFSFPQAVSQGIRMLLPSGDSSSAAPISEVEGVRRIGADQAVSAAFAAVPGARLLSVGLPLAAKQPYRVSLAHPGDGPGAPEIVVTVNPWSGELISVTDPARSSPAERVVAWQRMLHFGQGLGWAWRILVFLSGLLPVIFGFTGTAMWLIERSARRRVRRRALTRAAG